jgi:D-xylose 1-dehydrogenase (NADP+, D-xylono-1,5-lactone-forming)
MAKKLRWGILGTGNIARQFCAAMPHSRRGILSAVASRQIHRSEEFAKAHGIPAAYGNYESLLADPKVDAVYVALPNSLHCEWTVESLRAGKDVLCEKPLAMNLAEARRMVGAAKKSGRLLVEAFMYRSHPVTEAIIKAVRGGAIGELRFIRTSFCFRTNRIDGNVRFERKLGGGGLMDIGCYCIHFARLLAQSEPKQIQAVAHFHERGVDDLLAATMVFPDGLLSQFTCGLSLQANNTATIFGTEGYIEIPVPWKPQRVAEFVIARGIPPKMDSAKSKTGKVQPRRVITIDAKRELYAVEADDFAAAALDGKPQRISLEDSLGNMRVLDEIRRQIGLNFD